MKNFYNEKKDKYSEYIFNETDYAMERLKYDNFSGGHNDKKDALRHALMNAEKACFKGSNSSSLMGNLHEYVGRLKNQPMEEYYMDLWNNQVGRDIGEKIRNKYNIKDEKSLSIENRMKYRNLLIDEIDKKIKSGQMITDVKDKRIKQLNNKFKNLDINPIKEIEISNFIKQKYSSSSPTGFATNVDESLLNLENRVFYDKEINPNKTNDKEVLDKVIGQYFDNGKRIPSKEELNQQVASGDLIYVQDYSRSDGTKVSGYYRTHKNK